MTYPQGSQGGEEGVLDYIFSSIGTTNKFYVEFGTQNAEQINTRYFRETQNWKGILLDSGFEDHSIGLYKEWIFIDNIVALLEKYSVPKELDLLSVDLDSYDLWVLQRIMEGKYRPRVIVTEYNSLFSPEEAVTFPKNNSLHWDEKSRNYGASLRAFDMLMTEFGYKLIYTEKEAINAFFVRRDLLPALIDDFIPFSAVHRTRVHHHPGVSIMVYYPSQLPYYNPKYGLLKPSLRKPFAKIS